MTELIDFISNFQELDTKTEEAVRGFFKKEVYKKNEFIQNFT